MVALDVVDMGGVPPVPGRGSPAFSAAASWGNETKNGPVESQERGSQRPAPHLTLEDGSTHPSMRTVLCSELLKRAS